MTYTCLNCNKIFIPIKGAKGMFCSQKCHFEYIKTQNKLKLNDKKDMLNTKTNKELMKLYNVNEGTIIRWCRMIGIKSNYTFWADKNISFLKENYETLTNKQLAKKLNKSKSSIEHKLFKLKLKRVKQPTYKICPICNKQFEVGIQGKQRKLKFCSNKCYHISHRGYQTGIAFKTGHKINNGRIPWNKGITNKMDKRILGGQTHPKFGTHQSETSKKKISIKAKERLSDKTNHPMFGKKRPEMVILNRNPEFAKKRIQGLIKKPNKPEYYLIKLFKDNKLPYTYVGNGKVMIGQFNPDFLNCNGQKRIIELYGDYWHNTPNAIRLNKIRLETYTELGFKTLIIWEKELQDEKELLNKINNWNTNL